MDETCSYGLGNRLQIVEQVCWKISSCFSGSLSIAWIFTTRPLVYWNSMEHCMTWEIWITPAHHLSSALLFKQLARPARNLLTPFSKLQALVLFERVFITQRVFLPWKYQCWLKRQLTTVIKVLSLVLSSNFKSSVKPVCVCVCVCVFLCMCVCVNPGVCVKDLSGTPLFRFLAVGRNTNCPQPTGAPIGHVPMVTTGTWCCVNDRAGWTSHPVLQSTQVTVTETMFQYIRVCKESHSPCGTGFCGPSTFFWWFMVSSAVFRGCSSQETPEKYVL